MIWMTISRFNLTYRKPPMYRFLLTCVLLMALSVPAMAQEDTAALAGRVADVMPMDKQVEDFVNALREILPEERRDAFAAIVRKNVNAKVLRNDAIKALMATFTPAEMQAMLTFYATPEGQSVMSKMDQFGKALQPAVDARIKTAMQEAEKAGLLPEIPESTP